MSEQVSMTEENKKTIIAFIAGLLIGGLLVFIFANPAKDAKVDQDNNESTTTEQQTDESDEEGTNTTPSTSTTSNTNTGSTNTSSNQDSGSVVNIGQVTFPADEGWVGVRDLENGQLTGLLGVARWNREEGLLPTSVNVLRPTVAGKSYAVVFYSDNGDRQFNLANDAQIGGIVSSFKAE